MKKVIALYPGTFDPPTNGHLDLIYRSSHIVDELVVAVLRNFEKTPLFSVEDRVAMLRECTADYSNVRVECFQGLMVDFARHVGANAVLRGIRAVSDYEYELQMVWMNRKLYPELETIFMMPTEAYSYLSSRLVRQIAMFGGCLKDLVPPNIEERLRRKFEPKKK